MQDNSPDPSENNENVFVEKELDDATAATLETLKQARVPRRGRPVGSKNRPKTPSTSSTSGGDVKEFIAKHKNVARDEAGFWAEFTELVESWRSSCERPITYDFECAEAINALRSRYGMF